MSKNLHVCTLDKFIPPFLKFIRNEFEKEKNEFYMIGDNIKYPYQRDTHTVQHCGFLYYFLLIRSMYSADKIILHGLFNFKVILILALNPKLLKKSYWVIWGGDLYTFMFPKKGLKYRFKEKIRKYVIKRIAFLLTYIKGDIDLARKYYCAEGEYLETIEYLSNVVSLGFQEKVESENSIINIIVGNSADPSNEHFDALKKLVKFKDSNIRIYVPLSYGNKFYAQEVIEYGKSLFSDKFIGIVDFMEYSEYLRFLKNIDIAVFNHKRQQAMGNTINLLAMGKKVYLRDNTTQKDFFNSLSVKTFDIDNIDLSLNFSFKENSLIINQYFSKNNLLMQWKKILED